MQWNHVPNQSQKASKRDLIQNFNMTHNCFIRLMVTNITHAYVLFLTFIFLRMMDSCGATRFYFAWITEQGINECIQKGQTSISRASSTASGIGSGQNSSGAKLLSTLLISGAPNVGQTFLKNILHANK